MVGQGADGTPGFFGRGRELGLLGSLLGRCSTGLGAVAVILGEAGIGKTSLAVTFAKQAEATGSHVLWGAAWEAGAPPFRIWVDALCSGKDGVPDPAIAEVLSGCGGFDLRAWTRFDLFDWVASALAAAAEIQPLVIVLDDLHWADPDSLQLLSFVARLAPRSRMLILGTWRSADPSVPRLPPGLISNAILVAAEGLDIAAHLGLAPVAHRSRARPAREVDELLARTGGNPLFLSELGRSLPEGSFPHSGVPELPPLPSPARDVLQRALRHLPHEARSALDVAAVLGGHATLPIAADVLGLDVPQLISVLEPARQAGVLVAAGIEHPSTISFRHALFREVLLDDLGAVERMRLHAAVARVLDSRWHAGSDVDPSELAEHHLAAGDLGEPRRAVEAAITAAEQAERALAFEEAARLLRRGLAAMEGLDSEVGMRHEMLLRLGDLERRAGATNEARDTLTRAIRLAEERGEAVGTAHAVLGLARIGLPSGLPDADRRALFDRALAALPPGPTPARAELLAAAARDRYHANLGLPKSDASDLADLGVEMAEVLDETSTLAFCLLAAHDVRWGPGTAAERLAIIGRVTELGDDTDVELRLMANLARVAALLERGDPEALSALRLFVQRAASTNQPLYRYYATSRQALVAMLEDRLEDANLLARQAEEQAELLGEHDGPQVAIAQLTEIAALAGWRRELHMERGTRRLDAMHELIAIHHALGELAAGRRDVASAALASLLAEPERLSRDYTWLQAMSLLADAAVDLDDTVAAGRLFELLADYAGSCVVVAGAASFRGAVDHYLGILALTVGQASRAVEHFEAAVAIHERVGAQPWAARSRNWLTRALAATRLDGEETRGKQPRAASRGEWRRRGRSWVVTYGGRTCEIADSKGMRDLAVLLVRPGEDVHAVDLTGRAAATRGEAVLDERAKAAFRRRLQELEDDVAEAERHNDIARAAKAAAERETLVAELSCAVGLGGRQRRLGDDVERARKAVSARIRDAIERVGRVHPSLGEHLATGVSTGTWCAYHPVDPVDWTIAG